MRARTLTRIALSVLVLAVVTPACEQPATNVPAAPSTPSPNSIEIVGPSSIAPGQPAQLNANVRLADGSAKFGSPATGVTWTSSNTSVVQISQTGLATPIASQGDAFIFATLRIGNFNRSASREVVVQPAGTFRLVGSISEEGLPSIVVPNARVEVVPGSPFAIANAFGQYRLYGVPPVADIRVSADGYETRTFSVQLSRNDSRTFALPLIGERPTVAGNYTVFIDAVTCPASSNLPSLPAELQHRVYEAVVTQNASDLVVELTGGQFRTNSVSNGNHFSGEVINGGARFYLGYFDPYYYQYYGPYSYPSVAERLPDGRYLVSSGMVVTTGTPAAGFSGTFNFSQMYLWDANFPAFNSRALAGCNSGTRTLKLVPR